MPCAAYQCQVMLPPPSIPAIGQLGSYRAVQESPVHEGWHLSLHGQLWGDC